MLESTFLFLKGIGENRERRLWDQGVLDWYEFLSNERVPGVCGAQKALYDHDLEEAIAALHEKRYRYFGSCLKPRDHWRLFPTLQHRTLYLDIETDGGPVGQGRITLVGLYNGEVMTTLIAGESLTEERLGHELARGDLLVTFFGTGFDLPFLKAAFPRLGINHAHFDLCFAARRLGLKGGLKHIEQEIGLTRASDVRGLNGWDAVELWHAWKAGDDQAGARLCAYNETDVRNLEPLARHVSEQLISRLGPHPLI